MIEFKDKVIMISGANRGIGLETAKLLKEKGCILSLGARNPEEIEISGKNRVYFKWQKTNLSASSIFQKWTVPLKSRWFEWHLRILNHLRLLFLI